MTTARLGASLIKLVLNLIWLICTAGAVAFIALAGLVFIVLRLAFLMVAWVFALPMRVLEGLK